MRTSYANVHAVRMANQSLVLPVNEAPAQFGGKRLEGRFEPAGREQCAPILIPDDDKRGPASSSAAWLHLNANESALK